MERYYHLIAGPVPPVFREDFESDTGWTAIQNDGLGNTVWERGEPTGGSSATGPISGSEDSGNCFSTNLGDYGSDSDISLRSPVIDLTGLTGAVLNLDIWRDADPADTAAIRFLDSNTLQPLGGDIPIDLADFDTDWNNFDAPVPAEALGATVILEIQFTSADTGGQFTGLSVDAIEISAQ